MQLIRSRAPLRIGLAGGGTDVSPYSDLFGGAILNATISLYANASLEILDTNQIVFESIDQEAKETFDLGSEIDETGKLQLLKGVYNFIKNKYELPATGFKITTHVDAPAGSGLGTSSTLVVALVGIFMQWLRLPLKEYELAVMAYKIEREYLQLAGGKQDQYAATFGGVNFMEFLAKDNVIVNPLRIKDTTLYELENNIVLYFTASSRESATIIKEQVKNVSNNNEESINAMHQLKAQATQMKEALLKGNLNEIGTILNFGFEQKRKMAANISNSNIENIYAAAMAAGANGGKISGAGGGGFMFFYCPKNTKFNVIKALEQFGGYTKPFSFTTQGLITWML
jgi:D-glycero-alpha-D-manno-heptose-7-phosphate kinase